MVGPQPPPVPEWAQQPPPPRVPPPPVRQPLGWYADPWGGREWRWWDGREWTAHTHPYGAPAGAAVRRPRLPSFLSVPVLVAAVPGVALVVIAGILVPLSIVLGLVPLLLVAPVLWWMDRVEPEPWSARVHAFLWGAFVAGCI